MRQGNTLPSLVVAVLAIGIALYLVFSFLETMTDPYSTTTAYTFVVSDSVDTTGVIFRDEYLLPTATGLLDVLRTEGEQVGVGQMVARVYRDASSMEVQNQLELRIAEANSLEFAISEQKDILTVSKMDQEMVEAFSSLRCAVATGNYNKLEQQVAEVKGNVLRRDYIFGSVEVTRAIESRYQAVQWEISNSSQNLSGSMQPITTPVSGAYSILVDGYENYTTDMAMNLTLGELDQLIGAQGSYSGTDGGQNTGKIITGNRWYFATAVDSETCEKLTVGTAVTVRFSGDFSQDISMQVEKIGLAVEGRQQVVLSSDRYLEQTTLLRVQTVALVFDSVAGLRIPKTAMRMESYTHPETEAITQSYGVYVVSAGYAEFKPVTVLAEGADYYVVQSKNQGANALRHGNVVVVNAVGIYHGKLLEY